MPPFSNVSNSLKQFTKSFIQLADMFGKKEDISLNR